MQIVQVSIMQQMGNKVFTNVAEAETFVAEQLVPCAEEGETYVVHADPKGTGKALIEILFNGKSEGFF